MTVTEMEKQIVRAFVEDTIAAGYRVAVSLERGYDVEDMLLGSTDADEIMNEALAGDDAHLFVQPADGPTVGADEDVVSLGWVYIVLGNNGWDVISDYTLTDVIEKLLARADDLAQRLGE